MVRKTTACAGPDRLQVVSAHNGLAGLSPFEYREEREDTAERHGLHPDKMDAAVAERRTARWKANGHAKPEREQPSTPAIRVVTARELLAMEVPVLEHSLAPCCRRQGWRCPSRRAAWESPTPHSPALVVRHQPGG